MTGANTTQPWPGDEVPADDEGRQEPGPDDDGTARDEQHGRARRDLGA